MPLPRLPRIPACGFAILLFLLLPCGAASAAESLRSFKTQFYIIQTDLEKGEVVEFGRHMDRIFAQYQRRFQGFRSRRGGLMSVFLFRDRDGYAEFMRRTGIAADNSGGMFFVNPSSEGLATWTGGRSRSEAFEVLQHEGFHQFAYNYFGPELPIWANEGLAQYFEDALLVGARLEVGLVDDRRLAVVKRALAEGEAVPMRELLTISSQDWGRTLQANPQRSMLLYAQSWSLVYFLVHADNGKYQKAFSTYLELISNGRDSRAAFERAFGVTDARPIERRWRAYIESLEPDPVTSAIGKLEFLGHGLLFAREEKATISTLAQLRDFLRERRFRLQRTSHGVQAEFSATDPSMFRFTRKNGSDGEFEMLPPTGTDLPPRLRAPGLKPEPTLVWSRDAGGEVVQEVEFR